MKKGAANWVIVGLVAIVLVFGAEQAGYLSFTPAADGGLPGVTINVQGDGENGEPTTEEIRTNLVQLSIPYLMTGVKANCLAGGGTWMEQADWVGCVNYPPATIDCSTPLAQSASVQCTATTAFWTCNAMNVYCKY